ncbi:hypothetical protein SsS58_04885 [Streptomyces scabiei]|uniref:Uncharacterized protein n=1 Tax=Streptomyces scabiei TaxID=1930 RepID=A0A100JRT5_STRSC|nr:hypothetical protein SsS58_04885 [Streptomyces scabiei]
MPRRWPAGCPRRRRTGRRCEGARRRREGRKAGARGREIRRRPGPVRRPARPGAGRGRRTVRGRRAVRNPGTPRDRRDAREPSAVWCLVSTAVRRGSGPRPGAGRPPGGRRTGSRRESGPRPRAGRPGSASERPVARSGSGSTPGAGRPGNGRRRPGVAGWPGCRRSGRWCAGSRRSAGARRDAERCRRPPPRHGRGSGGTTGRRRAPDSARPAVRRRRAPRCDRAWPGRHPGRHPGPRPPRPAPVRGRARAQRRSRVRGPGRPAAGNLAGSRSDGPSGRCRADRRTWARRRNSVRCPGCSVCPPCRGVVRPGARRASARAPRTGGAECRAARARASRGAAAGGVARSGRSRPTARGPGGAGGPRSPPPGRAGTGSRSRTYAWSCPADVRSGRRCPGPADSCPWPGRRARVPSTEAGAGCSAVRPVAWPPARGPAVWTGGAGPVGAGGWRHDVLPCSCTPRFLVPCDPEVVRASDRPWGAVVTRTRDTPAGSRRHHGQAIPAAADRHPRRGRPCVRVTLRAGPRGTGTSPPARGFCPERPPTLR